MLSVVASIIGMSALSVAHPQIAWANDTTVVEKTFDANGKFPTELLEKDAAEAQTEMDAGIVERPFDNSDGSTPAQEKKVSAGKGKKTNAQGDLGDDENAAIDKALADEENAAIDQAMAKEAEKPGASTSIAPANQKRKKSNAEESVIEKSFGTSGKLENVVEKSFAANGQLQNVVEKSFGTNGQIENVVEKSFDSNGHLDNVISQAPSQAEESPSQGDELSDKAARALAQVNLPKPGISDPASAQPNAPQTSPPANAPAQPSAPQATGKPAKPKFRAPSIDLQKGLKQLQEMAGKTAKGLTVGSASFVAGCLVGTPIAICRRTKISTVKSARELYSTEHNPIILVASSPLIFPRGMFNGTLAGLLYGVADSLVNLDKPFSKACFSIGDFGTINK